MSVPAIRRLRRLVEKQGGNAENVLDINAVEDLYIAANDLLLDLEDTNNNINDDSGEEHLICVALRNALQKVSRPVKRTVKLTLTVDTDLPHQELMEEVGRSLTCDEFNNVCIYSAEEED